MKTYPPSELTPALQQAVDQISGRFTNILADARVEAFDAGEKIVGAHNKITSLRFLVQGKAKICLVHENGRASILDFIGSGDYIGELSFLEIETQPKDVIAISACICLCFPFSLTQDILTKDAAFLFSLNQYLGKKMLKRSWFHAKSQNYELKDRLAAYILRSETGGVYKEKHTETAEFLGVSYRHLLYTLQQFQQEGLLVKNAKGYKIHSAGLKLLAKDIDDALDMPI